MGYNVFMAKVIKIIQPPIDYSLIKPYVEQWVALTRDHRRVVAADKDPKKLMEKLRKIKVKRGDLVFQWVLDLDKTYSF